MRGSLVSREVVADSIELVSGAYPFDGVIALSGCDKTIPGTVMALARLDRPSLMLYGGSIQPGRFRGRDVTIQDVFEAIGACAAGQITEEDLDERDLPVRSDGDGCGAGLIGRTLTGRTRVQCLCARS